MGKMALGYGSEFHLLRMLGRHRNYLDSCILNLLGCKDSKIKWMDFNFESKAEYYDSEVKGIDFIYDKNIMDEWKKYWPQTGNAQNWDAIGMLYGENTNEYILIEAKAHIGELKSSSNASIKSLEKINATFDRVKKHIGVKIEADWTNKYYQLANRIAFLYFLNNIVQVKAKLANVLFLNDLGNSNRICPQSNLEWEKELAIEYDYLGITDNDFVKANVHNLFIPVDKAI